MSLPRLSRRHALLIPAAATAGACALAGCAPEDQGFGDADPIPAEDDGGVPLDQIPENASTLVNFGGQRPFALIVRGAGEDLTAYSGYCTHNGCALAMADDGAELDCPCHGSRFDASNAEVLRGPAASPLPAIAVSIKDGSLYRDA
ncbi:QcrA and Rieske domain-containing protein [Brachybacterium sp. DNPG3]